MKELNSLNQVAEFHRTFEHPILDDPGIPPGDRCKLRIELIAEELQELEEAIQNNDIVDVADALCDIQYVLSGAVLEFGLGNYFKELFNEVQRSNMSKVCTSLEMAEETVIFYKNRYPNAIIKKSKNGWIVYSQEGKVLKSIEYSKANLRNVLFEHVAPEHPSGDGMNCLEFFDMIKKEWCVSEEQYTPFWNDVLTFARKYHKERKEYCG